MTATAMTSARIQTTSAATTYYRPVAMAVSSQSTTESVSQIPFRQAGTLSKLTQRVSGNGVTATTNVTSRINAVNGNVTLAIGSSATGDFSDLGNSDTIASGDLLDYTIVEGATGTTTTIITTNWVFAASSGSYVRYSWSGAAYNVASTTAYCPLTGTTGPTSTTEVLTQVIFRDAGVLKHGFVNASANSRSTNSTCLSRINTANGNISVSVTALGTGQFEDLGNSDTIASGNTVNMAYTTGLAVGTTTCNGGLAYAPATNYPGIDSILTANVTATATTEYSQVGGTILGNNSTSAPQFLSIDCIGKNVFAYVPANSGTTGSATTKSYINGAVGNQTATIAFGATGYFEDLGNVDYITPTRKCAIQFANATDNNVSQQMMGMSLRLSGSVVQRTTDATLRTRGGSRQVGRSVM